MRKILFVFMILSLPLMTIAQSKTQPEIDERLYEVFEADFLERLQQKNLKQLKYYTYFLDNSFSIVELPSDKSKDMQTIVINNFDDINILKLLNKNSLKYHYDKPTHYKIKDTNKILVIQSGKSITDKFNKFIAQQ